MTDPFKLISERNSKPVAWACGKCGSVYKSEAHAKACCLCPDCGVRPPRAKGYTRCTECQRMADLRWARDRKLHNAKFLASAALIDLADYDVEQVSTNPHGDEDSYRVAGDEILDENGEPAAWAWACTVTTLGRGSINAGDIIHDLVEEWYEDAWLDFDEKALQRLLDDWCEAQGARCYYADPSRIVVLDPERRGEVEAMVAEAKRLISEDQ